jgi:ABC-2 type transport system permease protein
MTLAHRFPFLAFARLAFVDHLSYRVRYLVGILNYTIYMGVQYFLWSAVFASAPAGAPSLGGFRFQELITYFAVGWIVRVSYYNNVDRDLSDRVLQGDIALDLLRPVSLIERFYGAALGEAGFRVLFMGLPTALVLVPLFRVSGPRWDLHSPGGWLLAAAFGISVVLAFHVFFFIHFLFGAASVYFEKIRGLLWSKFILLQLLSGLLVPYDLFPSALRSVLHWLPFRAIIHGPVSIYLGRAQGRGLIFELGLQCGWLLVLALATSWCWSRCRRRLLIFGG